MTIEMLARIEGKHKHGSNFAAGIVLWDNVVIEAAPIVRFMKGWHRDAVRSHCNDNGWKVVVIWENIRRDIDSKGRAKRETQRD